MELVNATRKAIDSGAGAADPAVREAAEAVAIGLDMFAPHTAEDMWERLGHQPTVALALWPKADPSLLVETSVTAIIQVDGKVRDKVQVAPDIAPDDLRALAESSENVIRTLKGRTVVNVIVRAPRIVNIATKPE